MSNRSSLCVVGNLIIEHTQPSECVEDSKLGSKYISMSLLSSDPILHVYDGYPYPTPTTYVAMALYSEYRINDFPPCPKGLDNLKEDRSIPCCTVSHYRLIRLLIGSWGKHEGEEASCSAVELSRALWLALSTNKTTETFLLIQEGSWYALKVIYVYIWNGSIHFVHAVFVLGIIWSICIGILICVMVWNQVLSRCVGPFI